MVSRNQLVAVFLCCLFTLAVGKTIDRNDCIWQYTVRADTNVCHDGRVAVAACGSNDNAACVDQMFQNTVHTGLLCCATNDTCGGTCGRVSAEVGSDSGVPAYCPAGQVVVASCGSGGDSHCYLNGGLHSIVIRCRESIVQPTTNCVTQCAQKGINVECAAGYVMTGLCGSNGNQKCNADNDSHCVTCCLHQ